MLRGKIKKVMATILNPQCVRDYSLLLKQEGKVELPDNGLHKGKKR
jgi:hypothetical protein